MKSLVPCVLTTTGCTQIPIGSEERFAGLVDLVRMKAVVWNGEQLGASFEDQEIPEDLVEVANEYRLGLGTSLYFVVYGQVFVANPSWGFMY